MTTDTLKANSEERRSTPDVMADLWWTVSYVKNPNRRWWQFWKKRHIPPRQILDKPR
jgi:hypothetical protein